MGNSKSLAHESHQQGCSSRHRASHSERLPTYQHSQRLQPPRQFARIPQSGIYPHEYVSPTSSEPILFHDNHGINISVTHSGKVATRTNSFCYAIAFTSRPIGVGERITIKLKTVERGWSGVMRFGFTSHDPVTLRPADLPRYACPDLTGLPGYWAKALPEKFARQDNLLTFYVNSGGSVIYSINDIEQGTLFDGVDVSMPVWVIVDVYGNTTSLEIINKNRNPTLGRPSSLTEAIDEESAIQTIISLPNDMAQTVQEIFQLAEPISPIGFSLTMGPSLHCRNRKLMSRKGHFESSLAFTNTALKAGESVYMYCAENRPNNSNFLENLGSFGIGITTCDPSTIHISELPLDSSVLLDRPEYWIMYQDFEPPQEKEYFALTVEHEGFLSYKRQNQLNKVTLFHMDTSQPLYLVFDMHSKVSALAIVGMSSSPAPVEFYNAQPSRFTLEDRLFEDLLFEGLSGASAPNGRRSIHDDAFSSLNMIHDTILNSETASNLNSVRTEPQGPSSPSAMTSAFEQRNRTSTSRASEGSNEPNAPSSGNTQTVENGENEPGEAEPGEVDLSSSQARRGLSIGELAGLSAPIMMGALSWLGNRMVNRLSSDNNEMEPQIIGTASSSSSSSSSSSLIVEDGIEDEDDSDEFIVAPDRQSSDDSDHSDMELQFRTNVRLLDMLNSELGDLIPHLEMMSERDTERTSPTQDVSPPSDRTVSSSPGSSKKKDEEEQDDVKPSEECVICCDSKVNAVVYTCGHACMCYECGKQMLRQRRRKCPICRADIKDIIKVYHS